MKNLSLFTLTLLLLSACQQNDNELNELKPELSVLNFESSSQYTSYIKKVKDMSLQELTDFEEQQGFYSLRRKVETTMETLASTDFSSELELLNFVDKHSDVLQIIDDNGEKRITSKFGNSSSEYAANSSGFFHTSDNVLKVFDDGIGRVSKDGTKYLIAANSILDLNQDANQIAFDQPSSGTQNNARGISCSNQTQVATNGNNRTTTRISTYNEYNIDPIRWQTSIDIWAKVHVYSEFKLLGVWKPVKRTIYGYFKYSLDYQTFGGATTTLNKQYNNPSGKFGYRWVNKVHLARVHNIEDYLFRGFNYYAGWGDTASTDVRLVRCNDDVACANNSCVNPPSNLCFWKTCPSGKTCVNGNCMVVNDPCAGVICNAGQSCVGGVCRDNATCNPPCPGGSICFKGKCIQQ